MKGNRNIFLPLFLGIACAVGIFIGGNLNFSSDSPPVDQKKQKLARLIDYIEYEYVDDVNTDSIVEITVNGILNNLDPHSVYISQEEFSGVKESMQGDFVGIGVSFFNINDTIAVIQALEGSPGEQVGIRGGDRILYADGKPLFQQQVSNDSLANHLKGAENTEVSLKVYRKGEPELLDFKVRRGKVPLKSVDASYMLSPELGYIKINRFAESTYEEFREALQGLIQEGASKLVLDLRNNPGGYLSEATRVVDEFLSDNQLMLITKNKNGVEEKTYSTSKGSFEEGEVFVLINENSASASEIIAGALQDNDKGTIVGRRSYGKGLVQREMSLGDGSAVRLTIARYYTPTGRSIQKPYTNGTDAYFHEYLDRYANGELISEDSIRVDDTLKYVTPGGKVVYGGGGIIPDVFIPKNTDSQKETLDFMLRSGFMDRFVFEVLERDRSYYSSLSEEEFKTQQLIDNSIVDEFQEYTNNTAGVFPHHGFKMTFSDYHPLLKRYLKAVMAQQLFGSSVFEEIVNQDDPMLEKVMALSAD